MPQRTVRMTSLPQAFEVVKEMQADGPDWSEGCRLLDRRALVGVIEERMAEAVDRCSTAPMAAPCATGATALTGAAC